MAAGLKITLIKSLIGRGDKQIRTAGSLGLRKIGDVSFQQDVETVQGKINVISHLIAVEKE